MSNTDDSTLAVRLRRIQVCQQVKDALEADDFGAANRSAEELRALGNVGLEKEAAIAYAEIIDKIDDMRLGRGFIDVRQRILEGAAQAAYFTDAHLQKFLDHIEAFSDAAARHEYTQAEVNSVVDAVRGANISHAHLGAVVARLRRIGQHYHRGPAHLEALEQQWRSYRVNKLVMESARTVVMPAAGMSAGALQRATVAALRAAECYCWSPTPVEAVASAAEALPADARISPETLDMLAAPGACGWWWFEEPIPVRTLVASGKSDPVVALLWRREIDRSGHLAIWFSTFVMESAIGNFDEFPTPTTSWLWNDAVPLGDLRERLIDGYRQLPAGNQAAGLDVTVDASVWFSRFFLSAAVWLRQRIATTTRGLGTRQASRRLQREHGLDAPPRVEIVQLRRSEVAIERSDAPTVGREFSCRWIVHGHYRNQFYPSTGRHQVRWIDSYIKGPDDRPLKEAARVYAVMR
jgi:hypothetical protein